MRSLRDRAYSSLETAGLTTKDEPAQSWNLASASPSFRRTAQFWFIDQSDMRPLIGSRLAASFTSTLLVMPFIMGIMMAIIMIIIIMGIIAENIVVQSVV